MSSKPSRGWTRAALAAATMTAGAAALLTVPDAYPQISAAAPSAPGVLPSSVRPSTAALPDTGVSSAAPIVAGPNPDEEPTVLLLPGLGPQTRARVVPVAADSGGNLAVPEDPQVLGWWTAGARPADPAGTVVIDGHVDSDRYGIGFFVNLRRLRPGDPVVLEGTAGHASRWTVTAIGEYPSEALPQERVFSRRSGIQLALITCGGRFNRAAHAYSDNLVVYAAPDRGPAPAS